MTHALGADRALARPAAARVRTGDAARL